MLQLLQFKSLSKNHLTPSATWLSGAGAGSRSARRTGAACPGPGTCWQGNCFSHSIQCQLLWGRAALPASPHCFALNTLGNQAENCEFKDGENRSEYRACGAGDELCGLLHYRSEGQLAVGLRPLARLAHHQHLDCRTTLVDLGPGERDPGLAQPGTSCAPGRVSLHHRCFPLATVAPACPADCSGRGDCDNPGRCHCWPGYSGQGCVLRPGWVGLVGLGLLLCFCYLYTCVCKE